MPDIFEYTLHVLPPESSQQAYEAGTVIIVIL